MPLPQTVPYLGLAWDDLLFLLFGGLMLAAAIGVVLGRNIIRSGLSMILSFAALAGIYVLLGAPLVAAAQVLIYIGAISVLILFAIMLTQSKSGPSRLVFHHQAWAGALAAIVLGVLLIAMVTGADWPRAIADRAVSTTDDVARFLFSDFVLPFEIVSVLLLAAVIGGVFLAKREDADQPETLTAARQSRLDAAPGGGTGSSPGGIGSADRRTGPLDRGPAVSAASEVRPPAADVPVEG